MDNILFTHNKQGNKQNYIKKPFSPDQEKEQLLLALEKTAGTRKLAARLLGISRATFYRRLAYFVIKTKIYKP